MSQPKKETEYISQNIAYMIQALEGSLSGPAREDFNSLKSDKERFQYLWSRKEVHEIITIEKEYKEKSADVAKSFRESGNNYFQKEQYYTAMNEYNKCIINAPVVANDETKNELSLGYANRSAALFHLKKYNECIEDIISALENNYPTELLHKLYERRGTSYYNLGNFSKAFEDYEKVKDLINNLKENEKKSWIKLIEKKCALLVNKKESPNNNLNTDTPCTDIESNFDLGTTNPFYPNLSEMVVINTTEALGNHAVACCDIAPGQILVVEKPYTSVLFENAHSYRCYNCCKLIELPIPCQSCSDITFCSKICRDFSWTNFHRFECHFMALFNTTVCAKIGHLAIRLLMMNESNKLIEFLKGSLNNSVSAELVEQLKDYSHLYNLEMRMKQRIHDNSRFEFAFVACFFVKLLQLTGYLNFEDSSEELIIIGMCIIHHLYLIQCNGKLITEVQNPKKFDEPDIKAIGIGIYASVALINHSCDPSAEINFYNNVAVVKTLRTIYQWEQVTISYGPLFYKDKKLKRQKQLIYSHYFKCGCSACVNDWPIVEEMFNEVPIYQCSNCRKILTTEDLVDKIYQCKLCNEKSDIECIVVKLHDSFDKFAHGMNSAMNGSAELALPIFFQHLQLLQQHIRHPWRDLAACQNAIKYCFAMMSNKKLSNVGI